MAGAAIIGKLFGNAVSSAVGFGAGVALGPVLSPAVRDIANSVNSKYSFVFPEPGTLAAGVAQGQVDEKDARRWASYWGVGDTAFSALRSIADTGPPLASALTLLRRGVWLPDQYTTALNRQAIEKEWYPGLLTLQDEWLTPAELAVMVQRSVVPNPDLLPNQPSTAGSNVPVMPMVDIDTLKEAAGGGSNAARLAARARIIGLPASPDLAARMHFRDIITEGAFNKAILEGNTRGEWAPFLLEGFRQIPTAHEGIEGRLRGWLTDAEMYAQTKRHGMSQADTDLLFKVSGRPLSFHQVFIGLRRGGKYDGPVGALDPAFLKALQESNIRPEWYDLAWAQRYNYPSAFVLRSLTQSGDITEADAHQVLLFEGWEPTFAAKVAAAWSKGTSSAAKEATAADLLTLWDGEKATAAETLTALEGLGYSAAEAQRKMDVVEARRVAGAKSSAVGDLHTSYKKGSLSTAATVAALQALGVSAAGAAEIEQAWRVFLTAEGGAPPPTPA